MDTKTAKMKDLKDPNKVNLYSIIEMKPRSPQRVLSPKKISREDSDLLRKPPSRISPFKGKKSHFTDKEIFGTTPKRLLNTRVQSVDRNNFNSTTLEKPDFITLSSMTGMVASKSLNTPSRMIRGKRPSSEQLTRLNCPTILSTLRQEPNVNLLSKFQAKPILKRRLSPPNESDKSLDMTTTLNTLKNTGHPKDVISFLNDPELTQPRKKRAVTFHNADKKEISNQDIMKALQQVLSNQERILQRLVKLEEK